MPPDPVVPTAQPPASKKQRLEHVDAMRPIKQLGVVANHALIFFAPGASLLASCSILLLHVTREAFIFISACMLTYAYPRLARTDLKRFYSRRFTTVAIPYLCWTLIYFCFTAWQMDLTWASGLKQLGFLTLTGYYQLYFLVLLLQFYLVYPLLQKFVLALRRHHALLMIISLLVQVMYVSLMHWKYLPYWLQDNWANRELMSYQFYILGGMVAAYHFDAFHAWVVRHAKAILWFTTASAVVAVAWVVIGGIKNISGFGYESDPFQPIVVPFNIGAILSIYLLGLRLVRAPQGSLTRRAIMSGSDNSYGIYTAQLLFLNGLLWLGFGSLSNHFPWWIVVLVATAITFSGSWLLTAVLARTRFAAALTGRRRQSWRSLWA